MSRNDPVRAYKALSSIYAPINEQRWVSSKEIVLTWAGLLFTLIAVGLVAWEQGPILADQYRQHLWPALSLHALFLVIAALLVYGSLVYHTTRLGYIRRLHQHRPAHREELDALLRDENAPPVTILVPSYKEDRNVIYQTLMSAALQEYPLRRVGLVISFEPRGFSLACCIHRRH